MFSFRGIGVKIRNDDQLLYHQSRRKQLFSLDIYKASKLGQMTLIPELSKISLRA